MEGNGGIRQLIGAGFKVLAVGGAELKTFDAKKNLKNRFKAIAAILLSGGTTASPSAPATNGQKGIVNEVQVECHLVALSHQRLRCQFRQVEQVGNGVFGIGIRTGFDPMSPSGPDAWSLLKEPVIRIVMLFRRLPVIVFALIEFRIVLQNPVHHVEIGALDQIVVFGAVVTEIKIGTGFLDDGSAFDETPEHLFHDFFNPWLQTTGEMRAR